MGKGGNVPFLTGVLGACPCPSQHIMSEPEEITTMSGQKLPLKMSVDYISFSAHTDYQQTSEFIRALKPPHVVSVGVCCSASRGGGRRPAFRQLLLSSDTAFRSPSISRRVRRAARRSSVPARRCPSLLLLVFSAASPVT